MSLLRPTRLERLKAWLARCWPFISKKAHLKVTGDMSRGFFQMQASHREELRKQAEAIDGIIKRCAHIEFDRIGDFYAIRLEAEREFLAREIGYRVEREIATARFITSARQAERERMRQQRPPLC